VFTKQPTAGADRARWGGIIIAGDAPINVPGGTAIIEGTQDSFYGGTNPNDNSGELQYVRIEYAGHLFDPEVELNGIAFHGVGDGTTVDHVQVHMNKDDCIEMFGGTVNMKYMIGSWCRDDYFDWTEGWQGKAQYILVAQRADESDRGMECDNNATFPDNTPRSSPEIYNVTLIGDPTTIWGTESSQGILLRVGTAGKIHNLIIEGFKGFGIRVDNPETVNQITSGNLIVSNGIVSGNNSGGAQYDTEAQDAIDGGFWTNLFDVDPILCNARPLDIYNISPPDLSKYQYKPNFAPAPGSPAIDGSVTVMTPPADGFFDTSVNFIGAVDPNNDWTYGWTNFGSAKQLVCDVNYSGTVTVTDAQKILRMASGKDSVQSCADPNLSSSVTVTDAQKALRFASGKDPLETCCNQ
jgi:hypothetical protein